jgi:hypothetical protein
MNSIFSEVVRDEIGHTALLCNLLRRSDIFLATFYRFITKRNLPDRKLTIHSQFCSDQDGRPDILLEFGEDRSTLRNVVIEVKTRSSCSMTSVQSSMPGDRSYSNLGDVYYLVPEAWKYRHEADAASTRYWEEFSVELDRNNDLIKDAIFREYKWLLNLEFPSIRFSKAERDLMYATHLGDFVTSARKLHQIVDSLAQQMNAMRINNQSFNQVFTLQYEASDSEYGYNIKDKETDSYLLWFGMWSDHELLLGAGYRSKWLRSTRLSGFIPKEGEWNLLSLNELVLNQEGLVVNLALTRLEATLQEIICSRGRPQTKAVTPPASPIGVCDV